MCILPEILIIFGKILISKSQLYTLIVVSLILDALQASRALVNVYCIACSFISLQLFPKEKIFTPELQPWSLYGSTTSKTLQFTLQFWSFYQLSYSLMQSASIPSFIFARLLRPEGGKSYIFPPNFKWNSLFRMIIFCINRV